MFKKMILVLTLVLALAIGGAWGFEQDEQCTISAGAKMFLIAGPNKIMPVKANIPLNVKLGEVIPQTVADRFNQMAVQLGETDMDWTGARLAMVDDGNMVVVRAVDTVCPDAE